MLATRSPAETQNCQSKSEVRSEQPRHCGVDILGDRDTVRLHLLPRAQALQRFFLGGCKIPFKLLGQVFAAFESAGRTGRVAVIGLGAGTTAAYRRPGQDWTFYEIDPVVEQIARDDRYFSYLSDRAADIPVVLGDARLALAHAPDLAYDLMILDAFSSDAIPLHLMTREALRLYLDKLAPGGVIAFHISNRMLDLAPVLGNLVADAGAAAMIERFRPAAAAEPNIYIMPSD